MNYINNCKTANGYTDSRAIREIIYGSALITESDIAMRESLITRCLKNLTTDDENEFIYNMYTYKKEYDKMVATNPALLLKYNEVVRAVEARKKTRRRRLRPIRERPGISEVSEEASIQDAHAYIDSELYR